jgi:alpha-beta hydrolase superfamily lysophospholipase
MNYFEPIFDKRVGYQRFYLDLPGHGRSHRPRPGAI